MHPDLDQVVNAWARLPDDVKAATKKAAGGNIIYYDVRRE